MNERDPYSADPRRSYLWPAILLLIAFLLGTVATVLTLRHWPQADAWLHPAPAAQIVARPQPATPPPTAMAAAAAHDIALTQRVGAVEDHVDRLDARVAAATGDADRAEGLLVAFAARRALDRGQSLGFLEGLLRERFGATDAAAVAQVIAAAQRPVTLPQLQDGLAALRPSLLFHGPSEGVWPGIKRELAGLFVIRRAGVPSAIPDDRFARADHALEQGQADVAAAEVARMPGSAQAGAWLTQTRRYVMARNALDRLETAALLTPPATAPAPPTLTDETH